MGILNMHMHNPLLITFFGILGNIVSSCVFAAPAPTFYRIYKRKSTEGFQSVPYVVALFSAMLWFYYGFIKTHVVALITINAIGCVVETVYIAIYYKYSTRDSRVFLFRLILLFNVGLFGVILFTSSFLIKKTRQRVQILGWVCTVFSTCVFVAPLSIMRKVVHTKSVEFMPFWLSFFLMLTAVVWLFYGLLLNDIYIIIPNVAGIFLAILQMILYALYKDNKIRGKEEEQLPEQKMFDIKKPSMEKQPVIEIQVSVVHENKDEQVHEEAKKINQAQMVTIEV